MISLALLAAAAASTPTPGHLKTFSDWIVGCDNGRACQADALQPEGDFDAITMVVARAATAGAAPDISINTDQTVVAALAADGRKLSIRTVAAAGVVSVFPQDSRIFVEAVRPAKRLGLLDAKGVEIGHVSLAGFSAALLYMDDQQKRVGTVTALIRKGPATSVPVPPPLPVIVSPIAPKLLPLRLGKADIARETRSLECEAADSGNFETLYARLDARTSLALLPWPCGNGAYNYFAYALLIDQKGNVTAARFDAPAGMGEENDNSVVNADWDEATRRLSTYAKGRGLGDCGTMQSFAWDGNRFRLVEQSEMGECRGSVDYITTWRAAVSRR